MNVEELAPRLVGWERVEARLIEQGHMIWLGAYQRVERDRSPLRTLISIDLASDMAQGDWLHLSVSRRTRLPTWGDLCKARDELGYADRLFVQLLPPTSHWLNLHGHTLHMISRLDAETLPRITWDQAGADGRYYKKLAPLNGRL